VALRDSWQSALVYFGLAEDRDPAHDQDQYEQEPEYEERHAERASIRRTSTPSRRRGRDDYDDIFGDDDVGPAPSRKRSSAPPARRNGNGDANVQVHLVIPKSFNDAQQIADRFKEGVPVVLNLQSSDTELAKRLIDFASGLTYAMDGGMQRVADKVFMLTPRNVDLSAEERAQLIEKGFFNQT
jgi:cell division inhibitor SepF